jgi:outer membrane protein assembly factor BamA
MFPLGHALSTCLAAMLLLTSPLAMAGGDETPPTAPSYAPLAAPRAVPPDSELEANGAEFGEIRIDNQNIFDLDDPKEDTALFRFANRVHIRTREEVIRNQLLFHTGEPYSRRLMDESERLLRSARYLYDASIVPIAYHDGKVDVRVTTRDVWTLNPGISFGRHGGANTFGIELEELNLLGTGQSISISHKSGIDRDENLLEFKGANLRGSRINVQASYANNSDGLRHELLVDRPFYSLDTRGAGGIALADNEQTDSLYDLGHIVDEFQERRHFVDLYGGLSHGLQDDWARRLTFGFTYDARQFEALTEPAATTALPEDRKLVYPWIGFDLVQDDYRKLKNHDEIERTEDFFLGTRITGRLGFSDPALGADRRAVIFAATAGHGWSPTPQSTLLYSGALSGRYEEGEARNAMLDAGVRYYVEQSRRWLFYGTLQGTVGRNLDLDNQILLGGDNGLRGYPLRYQGGDSRALLTLEQRYFTDWYPFRLFRVGGAAFVDVGRTWGDAPLSTPSLGLLKDVGIGLRLGSSRSGLGNIIHVDLAFPLDGDPSISKVQLLVETKERF